MTDKDKDEKRLAMLHAVPSYKALKEAMESLCNAICEENKDKLNNQQSSIENVAPDLSYIDVTPRGRMELRPLAIKNNMLVSMVDLLMSIDEIKDCTPTQASYACEAFIEPLKLASKSQPISAAVINQSIRFIRDSGLESAKHPAMAKAVRAAKASMLVCSIVTGVIAIGSIAVIPVAAVAVPMIVISALTMLLFAAKSAYDAKRDYNRTKEAYEKVGQMKFFKEVDSYNSSLLNAAQRNENHRDILPENKKINFNTSN